MAEGARIIWILFGDMNGFEADIGTLKSAYRSHDALVVEHGYTLGIPDYLASKKTFLELIGDSATRGLVWHSHGAYSNFGPSGQLLDREKRRIAPGDLKDLKLQLDFAALFGCGVAHDKTAYEAWKKALGLQEHRGAYGSFESRMVADTIRAWFWGTRYGHLQPEAQKFVQHGFPNWIKQL